MLLNIIISCSTKSYVKTQRLIRRGLTDNLGCQDCLDYWAYFVQLRLAASPAPAWANVFAAKTCMSLGGTAFE